MIQPAHKHSANPPLVQSIKADRRVNLALLESSAIIRFSGADAAEFLQGQLTNDVELATGNQAHLTGYCNPKGRLIGLFQLLTMDDSYVAITGRDLVTPLIQRLQMFVMRSAVTIENLSDEWAVVGLWGSDADEFLRVQGLSPIVDTNRVADSDTHDAIITVHTGFDQSAYQLIGPRSSLTALLGSTPQALADENSWQSLAINAGYPDLTKATADAFIPQMLNLDLIDGVNFQKGCYPGQEIVARTRYLGKLKRRMFLFNVSGDDIKPGDPVYSESNEQSVGTVVNRVVIDGGQSLVLAVIRFAALQGPLKTADGLELTRISLPYSVPVTPEENH